MTVTVTGSLPPKRVMAWMSSSRTSRGYRARRLGDRLCGNKKGTRRSRTEWPTKCGKQRRWRQNWQLNPKRKSPWSAITHWDFVTSSLSTLRRQTWEACGSHLQATMMQEESAASAATRHPYGTPPAGSLLPKTSFGPADKGFSSLKGTARLRDRCQSCGFKMLQLWSKRQRASTSRPRTKTRPRCANNWQR